MRLKRGKEEGKKERKSRERRTERKKERKKERRKSALFPLLPSSSLYWMQRSIYTEHFPCVVICTSVTMLALLRNKAWCWFFRWSILRVLDRPSSSPRFEGDERRSKAEPRAINNKQEANKEPAETETQSIRRPFSVWPQAPRDEIYIECSIARICTILFVIATVTFMLCSNMLALIQRCCESRHYDKSRHHNNTNDYTVMKVSSCGYW